MQAAKVAPFAAGNRQMSEKSAAEGATQTQPRESRAFHGRQRPMSEKSAAGDFFPIYK
jgi:hypothetical protein